MTVEEFIKIHRPESDFAAWAKGNGLTTMKEVWESEDLCPERRVWIATEKGALDNTMLLSFMIFCFQQAKPLMNVNTIGDEENIIKSFSGSEYIYNAAWNSSQLFASIIATDAKIRKRKEMGISSIPLCDERRDLDKEFERARLQVISDHAKWLIENAVPEFCK